MSYYQLHRISNSDLTIAEHLLSGTPYTRPEAAFRLGSAFHALLLEPEKFRAQSCQGLDLKLLFRMYRTVISNQFCQSALADSEKEKVILWQEPTTGIACKCRLDMILTLEEEPAVIDFKTTSAASLAEFLLACQRYHYDRQMAFYADSIQAQQICLIGVSKQAQRLFFVQKYVQSNFIVQGRRKYRHLLERIQELDLFETIYYQRRNGSSSSDPADSVLQEPPSPYHLSTL